MTDDMRKPVLEDHVKVKKKLVPPFMQAFGGKLAQYSWTQQLVPEFVWIGLLIDQFGPQKATELCVELVNACVQASKADPQPLYAKFSSFISLDNEEQEKVRQSLSQKSIELLRVGLHPLSVLINEHPLAFLLKGTDIDGKVDDKLGIVLKELYDRNSRISVLSMATAYYVGIRQGKIHLSPHLVDGMITKFKDIEQYPDTEESRDAEGAFRASAPMFIMSPSEDTPGFADNDDWVSLFWDRISGFGPCLFPDTLTEFESETDHPLDQFIIGFQNTVKADLKARLKKWPPDLKAVEKYEVVTALLCRQTTLALDLAGAPQIWNTHTAPLLLRAMADVFITLAWILKDPLNRSKKFVEDGLGSIKLEIAHRRRELEKETDPDEIAQLKGMIEIWDSWLKSQRLDQFIEVNLGSWSGLNTRQMAEEAGFIDFYNYVYQPWSRVVHSNWAHVSSFNTDICQNPAHRLHRTPAIPIFDPDPYWLFLCAKYLNKTFVHFDEMNGFTDMPEAAFTYVVDRLYGEPEATEGQ